LGKPESLGSIIARASLPATAAGKRRELDLIRIHWEHLAGERLALHSEPTKLARGILTISAEGPAWAAEVATATRDLMGRLEESVGGGKIRKIRVRSAGVRRGAETEPVAEESTGESDGETQPIVEGLARELDSVEDEETRKSLERLVRASRAGRRAGG